ncbi:hypothetical protein MMC07_000484 [Pseudocyphellaria aurata]|nr:hypothetical protein [Pseudocyphellaria aurata]
MFSRAGRTRTQIGKRQLLGMNLPTAGVSHMQLTSRHREPSAFWLTTADTRRNIRGADSMERHLPTRVVKYQPPSNRPEGKKELSQDRKEKRGENGECDSGLDEGTGWDDTERKDAEDDEYEVLHIVERPTMSTEGAEGIGRRVRCLEGGKTGGGRLSTSDL